MEDLIEQMKRLDCYTGEHAIECIPGDRGRVELLDGTSRRYDVDVQEMADLLGQLPDGTPVEEGIDGSVWEVIIALSTEGYGFCDLYLGGLGL